ncbi:DUF4407 domain-containing protein [Pinibacter aurantiacus]|uniref:DUF4407 domain-containing protein n=1 Tax=Pinibacter aurantiacus TaxID=2851599 RepID=A0A9E2SBK9_9BACT|nr:DUF4407 domain-containing protein [Pinibacter aurantiacus]MBV4358464.1 DUF4407 domain-containing protein [Pinibacter aurantiacus]
MSTTQNGHQSVYGYDDFQKKTDKPESNFLWWCSGAYTDLLRKYPSEHTKYAGIGGVILATFVLAAISSGYAVYSVFGNWYWTVAFAIIWGLIIFNFDRFLVSTMRKYGVSARKQLLLAVPRFALALLIGITIARPLELKIFEKEIDVKVAQNRHDKILLNDSLLQKELQTAQTEAQQERSRLMARKGMLEDTLHTLQQAYIQEADGTGGSGKRGIDKLTKLKMEAYNNASKQFAPELKQLDSSIHYQDSIINSQLAGLDVKKKNYEAELQTKVGFLERNKALADLSREESSVWWSSLCISLLIILIEIGPILSKLIMNVGPYDIALSQMELIQMARSENEMRRDKELLHEKMQLIFRHKKDITEDTLNKAKALQQKYIQSDLDKWEKGDSPNKHAPLNNAMKDIKSKYDFEEESVI